MQRLAPYLWSFLLFLVIVIASVALSFLDYSWEGWKPATCMPDQCFCERIRDGTIRQPSNTWSNHALVLVGLLIITAAKGDVSGTSHSKNSNPMTSKPAYPIVFGLSAMLTGFGSMFYHASLTFLGQWFDVMGMYLLASFLLLYSSSRLLSLSSRAFVVFYPAINILLGYSLVAWPDLRRYVFGLLIVAALASEVLVHRTLRPRVATRYLGAAILSLAIAFGIWILDLGGIFCSPDSWLQGHAVWHILSALAIWYIYLYMRSEVALDA